MEHNPINNLYQEQYRPQFHFTPPENWMNDPNGLVYYEGEYHLFYQYHPDSLVWGPMHWGHAVSEDLVHWDHLPIALEPDEKLGMAFSGSAVVDQNDTSGLFNGKSGLVVIYTNCKVNKEIGEEFQQQSIAYSKDKGRTWTKYDGNPVLVDSELDDFRDPKVIWHQPTEKWIMVLACGDRVRFYGSNNLKEWDYLSEFGAQAGSHAGVWECPDLFQLPVEGAEEKEKWVLEVDVQGGAPAGGSGAQYFIGKFDGKQFINDNSANDTLWVDYGADFYAAQSWANILTDDGRRLWIAWMNNWDYAGDLPTKKWRGAMTVPREVGLIEVDEEIKLVQTPVAELQNLRTEKVSWEQLVVTEKDNLRIKDMTTPLEIVAEFELATAGEFGFKIGDLEAEKTTVGYNVSAEEVFVNRTNSGRKDFTGEFGAEHTAILKPQEDKVKLRILVDWSSIELFANQGQVTMTERIFPEGQEEKIKLYEVDGEVTLKSMQVYKLESIW